MDTHEMEVLPLLAKAFGAIDKARSKTNNGLTDDYLRNIQRELTSVSELVAADIQAELTQHKGAEE